MKKKILAASLCAAMVLSLTACAKNDDPFGDLLSQPSTSSKPASSAAAGNTSKPTTSKPAESKPEESSEPASSNVEDFNYTETDGKITITRYKGSDTAVVFPKTIDGKPVDTIGREGNGLNPVVGENVESVVIPEGVTKIDVLAFYNCEKLADITVPKSVTDFIVTVPSMVMTPFEGTAWLKNKRAENPLVIANDIVIDGKNCTRSVEIPEGVKAIAPLAFSRCTTVTKFTLPKSLEKIGAFAFAGCERLTDIVIPDSVSSIGDRAFLGCSALENVTLPNNPVEIGYNVFCEDFDYSILQPTPWLENLRAVDPLVIVNGILIDGKKCTGDVVVPDSVKSIAAGAFGYESDRYARVNIKSITLPNGIKKIPDRCFSYSNLESITIPDSVTEIGANAFCYSNIKKLTIPNSVKKIDYDAFSRSPLESITLPETLTKISNITFYGCGNLKSITLPETLTEIGNSAFYDCGLTSITIPDSVTYIGDNAFNADNDRQNRIKSVTLPDNIKYLGTDVFAIADITYRGEIYFPELYNELLAEIEKNNS